MAAAFYAGDLVLFVDEDWELAATRSPYDFVQICKTFYKRGFLDWFVQRLRNQQHNTAAGIAEDYQRNAAVRQAAREGRAEVLADLGYLDDSGSNTSSASASSTSSFSGADGAAAAAADTADSAPAPHQGDKQVMAAAAAGEGAGHVAEAAADRGASARNTGAAAAAHAPGAAVQERNCISLAVGMGPSTVADCMAGLGNLDARQARTQIQDAAKGLMKFALEQVQQLEGRGLMCFHITDHSSVLTEANVSPGFEAPFDEDKLVASIGTAIALMQGEQCMPGLVLEVAKCAQRLCWRYLGRQDGEPAAAEPPAYERRSAQVTAEVTAAQVVAAQFLLPPLLQVLAKLGAAP